MDKEQKDRKTFISVAGPVVLPEVLIVTAGYHAAMGERGEALKDITAYLGDRFLGVLAGEKRLAATAADEEAILTARANAVKSTSTETKEMAQSLLREHPDIHPQTAADAARGHRHHGQRHDGDGDRGP